MKDDIGTEQNVMLTPSTSTERKPKNEQRKRYRILISNCWPFDIRLFDFYRKRTTWSTSKSL